MIFDSCTFAWHTGQLTVRGEEEDEEVEEGVKVVCPAEEWREEAVEEDEVVAVAVLCCIAGDFTESLPDVFWKKLEMEAELPRSSHGLFLDAPDALSPLE